MLRAIPRYVLAIIAGVVLASPLVLAQGTAWEACFSIPPGAPDRTSDCIASTANCSTGGTSCPSGECRDTATNQLFVIFSCNQWVEHTTNYCTPYHSQAECIYDSTSTPCLTWTAWASASCTGYSCQQSTEPIPDCHTNF